MSHGDVAHKGDPPVDQVNSAATRVPIDSSPARVLPKLAVLGVWGGGQVGTFGACATIFIGHRHSQPAPTPTTSLSLCLSLSPFLVPLALTLSKERSIHSEAWNQSARPLLPCIRWWFAGPERDEVKRRAQILQISSPMTHAIPPPLGTSSSHHQEETSVWLRGWLESVPGSSSTEANDRRRHHRCCCRIDVTAGIGSHASP